jgi:putative hemolysin
LASHRHAGRPLRALLEVDTGPALAVGVLAPEEIGLVDMRTGRPRRGAVARDHIRALKRPQSRRFQPVSSPVSCASAPRSATFVANGAAARGGQHVSRRRGTDLNAPGADVYQGLLGALLCAAIGSIFAATDAALSSLSHAHLLALQDQAHGRSKAALDRYLAKPASQHSQWLVGRVVFTALAAVLVANVMVPYVPGWALAPLGALGALLTFGTLAQVGTTIGRARPDYFATRALANVHPLELLVWPLAAPLSKLGHLATDMLGPAHPRDATVTKTEVELVVDESEKEGSLGEEPAEMIRNVLGLKDLVVRDVMVPRTRVCAIEAETPLIEVLRFAAVEGHSRYPVYREKIDNVVGVLYVKDLFRIVNDNQLHSTRLRDLVRANVSFVPEMQTVSSVLADMRSHRLHLAIVIDEFGGVSGVVTLEDILEVIVGEIGRAHV